MRDDYQSSFGLQHNHEHDGISKGLGARPRNVVHRVVSVVSVIGQGHEMVS